MQAITPPSHSRKTILTAAALLKALGHSGFDQFLMELGLPDRNVGLGSGLMARSNSLAKHALEHPTARTAEGQMLEAAIVEKAWEIYHSGVLHNIRPEDRDAFHLAASSNGIVGAVTNPSRPGASQSAATVKPKTSSNGSSDSKANKRVFIVHGHDIEMQQTVAHFVTKIGLEPVILADQVNGGKTIIEKFEHNADVGYAIILLSPDDPVSSSHRARQNVILEWGYFIGRLGRTHVCALKRGVVELPSDIIGIVWQVFDDNGGWKRSLANELDAAGLKIDKDAALKG